MRMRDLRDAGRSMFDSTSRYAALETATFDAVDGRVITYVRRRFLPPAGSHRLLVEVTVSDADRLDLIAHRSFGNSEQYWRVCDANDAMNPFDLTAEVGRVLRVPLPQV
jgi:hypothetical protein